MKTIEQRFWEKVEMIPFHECWEWKAYRNNDNYGTFQIATKKNVKAHRFSYELNNGPVPEGLCVCHTCDNPGCVRPNHLWLGTMKDNSKDMALKGRHGHQKKTHCRNGHIFNKVNARYFITNRGGNARSCRICEKLRMRKTRAKNI